MEKRATKLNDLHLTKAHEHIAKLQENQSSISRKRLTSRDYAQVDLAIGVITVPRSHSSYRLDYLTQTFAKLHEGIAQDPVHFNRKTLFICNTFPGPGNHSELQPLRSLVPVHDKYSGYDAHAADLNRFEKEKQDYVYCLDQALLYKPKYILIVEDDSLAVDSMFEVLHYVLLNLVENKFSLGDRTHNTEKWAYLKLFYPNRWKGYGFELIPMLELMSIASVGGTLFVLIGYRCNKRESFSMLSTVIYFLIGSIYLALAAYMVGRPYLIEWRRISKYTYTVIPAPECCSPAILYATEKAKELRNYLTMAKCTSKYPVDFAMDEFVKVNNYTKYLIEPNLMQHIGMFSSIKSKSKNPQQFIYRH